MSLVVTSSAFAHETPIPSRYTCDDQDISPPLAWTAGPVGTESYALIMDDPDAPGGTWVHWIAWNINGLELPEDEANEGMAESPLGQVRHGTNSWDRIGYGGPCPPTGTHRYYFKVYALDRQLDLASDATKQALVAAMESHILAHGELMGTYAKKK
ncbi:MAG: YbhB/YbcL family Raf kinase inhibitor-like protein [Planctomycetota bacterium]|jgi:Raf kinase inhibitor-like YbhB/YbcL family protein